MPVKSDKRHHMFMPARILIAAGPTREHIDPVRYLSNDSSGQMGFALARAAKNLGFEVEMVSGPVSLHTPEGVVRTDVVRARDMLREVTRRAARADVIIMAAAVADWRPAKFSRAKIKKRRRTESIALVQNPDILFELSRRRRGHQVIVGFALETDDLEGNAAKKLKDKGCDWMIANSAQAIGAKSSRAILMSREGKKIKLPKLPKEDLAVLILSHILG